MQAGHVNLGIAVKTTEEQTLAQDGRAVGRRGLATRQKLLAATAQLLSERSIRDIRVVDITRIVDTSPATFYQYFQDVTEATLMLAESAAAEMPEIVVLLDQTWNGAAGMNTARSMVEAFLTHWDRHRSVLRVRNLAAEEGDARFRQVRSDALGDLRTRLAEVIKTAQEGHEPGNIASADAASIALVAMLERVGAYSKDLEVRGLTRQDMVKTLAGIIHQTVNQ